VAENDDVEVARQFQFRWLDRQNLASKEPIHMEQTQT
jgi:hypothetical protein